MANYWAHTPEVVGSSEGQCHKIFQLDHISCILRWRFRKSGSWVLKTKWKFGENYPEAPESRQNWLYRTFGLPERCINHSNEFWIVPGPFQSVPWPVANFRFVLKSRPRLWRSPCFLRGLRGVRVFVKVRGPCFLSVRSGCWCCTVCREKVIRMILQRVHSFIYEKTANEVADCWL